MLIVSPTRAILVGRGFWFFIRPIKPTIKILNVSTRFSVIIVLEKAIVIRHTIPASYMIFHSYPQKEQLQTETGRPNLSIVLMSL
jgi:hypothetical protein